MNKYCDIYNTALLAYQQQQQRPGYAFGWLSRWRHSCSPYPHIEQLQKNLLATNNDETAKQILENYFKHPNTTFNQHSFSRYLLDTLEINCRGESWENLDPAPLVFYQAKPGARLYRGTPQAPFGKDGVFQNGMIAGQSSERVSQYAATSNLNIGISTTKNFTTAQAYAASAWVTPTAKGCFFHSKTAVYVYEIDYRDGLGIDIEATAISQHANFLSRTDAKAKTEVNIAGPICAEDVVAVWEITPRSSKKIQNPNYQKTKPLPDLVTPERLQIMFAKT